MNDPVRNAYGMLIGLMTQGDSVDAARSTLIGLGIPVEIVDQAVARYRSVVEGVFEAAEPPAFHDRNRLKPWYPGPLETGIFWPRLREQLLEEGFGDTALQSLDAASTKVVSHLPNWAQPEFSGRGLVLGYVQSGKTSNFTAVMAKAADAGYRCFIVLSGLHNNLRRQTQIRLDEQLVGTDAHRWIRLTDEERDFGNPGNADAFLSQDQRKLLAVVKKNKSRLQNLIQWLGSASEQSRRSCPILVIDDEADQASVNTGDQYDRAVINGLLLKLLAQPRLAYVGYTATPFANIFIDPTIEEDLYPRDFIVDLPRPDTYFGPERIFGREPVTPDEAETGIDGLDMVRLIPDHEAALLRPPKNKVDREAWEPLVTTELERAIVYFLLATAARRTRGHAGKHSSMLIHTTQYAAIHHAYQDPIAAVVRRTRRQVDEGDTTALRMLWDAEKGAVPAEIAKEQPVSFDELLPHLPDVTQDARVIVDNYLSDDRLDYGRRRLDENGKETDEIVPQVVIAVGGNTLSRGLTLEGLVVSFFLRTSTAYDTLLQMGRWFGFRNGYADLPRIWLTQEMRSYFEFLAAVEAEMRIDVERYELEDLRPDEFAVRVRTHPKLAITSALKMQKAVDCSVSYSDRRLQTILFHHRNESWLRDNLAAGGRLLDAVGGDGTVQRRANGRLLWKDVPVAAIRDFLKQYRFHEDSYDLRSDLLLDYIEDQNSHGELLHWNLGVVTREPEIWGTVPLGEQSPVTVGLINRAAVSTDNGKANIKSLMSRPDRVLDLELTSDQLKAKDAELQALRPTGRGLLILYPVNRASVPQDDASETRVALDAVEHVLGLGLVFPKATRGDTVLRYKSVELPTGDVEEFEVPDEAELDTEESFTGEAA